MICSCFSNCLQDTWGSISEHTMETYKYLSKHIILQLIAVFSVSSIWEYSSDQPPRFLYILVLPSFTFCKLLKKRLHFIYSLQSNWSPCDSIMSWARDFENTVAIASRRAGEQDKSAAVWHTACVLQNWSTRRTWHISGICVSTFFKINIFLKMFSVCVWERENVLYLSFIS